MENFLQALNTAFTENLVISIIDIVAFALLLYVVFAFLKRNNTGGLIKYIVIILFISSIFTTIFFQGTIIGQLFSSSLIILPVVIFVMFPTEIRRSLYRISSSKEMQETFKTKYDSTEDELKTAIEHIVRAVQNMAKKNTGALIVIAPEFIPTHILESGTEINGRLSSALIETVFNTKAPLHDGAMIIRGDRILATGCFLPLSQNNTIDKELGTRHRAAIGVTEVNNVFAIIVSEENGVISTSLNGQLNRYYDSAMLTDILMQIYGLKAAVVPAKPKSKNNSHKKRSTYGRTR